MVPISKGKLRASAFTAAKMVPKEVKVQFHAKNKKNKKQKSPLEKWISVSRFSFLIYSFQSVFMCNFLVTVCT